MSNVVVSIALTETPSRSKGWGAYKCPATVAETAAREAGIAWADREAGALEGAPAGAWLSSALDARPLVEDLESTEDFDPAAVCNAAAAARWADLVGMAEAAEHFATDAVP